MYKRVGQWFYEIGLAKKLTHVHFWGQNSLKSEWGKRMWRRRVRKSQSQMRRGGWVDHADKKGRNVGMLRTYYIWEKKYNKKKIHIDWLYNIRTHYYSNSYRVIFWYGLLDGNMFLLFCSFEWSRWIHLKDLVCKSYED